jgi:hypothetical protein
MSATNDDGCEYIFRASITLKNGKILFARDCGLKAFRIRVKKDKGTDTQKTKGK